MSLNKNSSLDEMYFKTKLADIIAEIKLKFYHSQNGKGGDIKPCERFCCDCAQTKRIVDFLKTKI